MRDFRNSLQCPTMIGMPERLRKIASGIESGKIQISLETSQKLNEILRQIEKGELRAEDFIMDSNTVRQTLQNYAQEVQNAVGNKTGER